MADNKTNFANFIKEFIVEIPRIQRDYVQGQAIDSEQEEKRQDFVNSMIAALEDSSTTCVLDFVYGFTTGDNINKTFIPLDGQQRLTSLFLLHWYLLYLLKRNQPEGQEPYDKDEQKKKLLNKHFRYNNRISSTSFCERLTSIENDSFLPIDGDIRTAITQQAWFDDEWLYDPTIETMIDMLCVYEKRMRGKGYDELIQAANRLFDEDAIYFDKLDLEDLHQGESLYIKMNARGKKLTQFENWKSKFTKLLADKHCDKQFEDGDPHRCNRKNYKDYFSNSVEHEWNDIFWHFVTKDINWESTELIMSAENPTVDRAFTNFMKFFHSILYFRDNGKKGSKIGDFKWTFAQNEVTFGEDKSNNLDFLFQCLDFLASIQDYNEFFDEIFYTKDQNTDKVPNHKVRYYGSNGTNLFEKAIGYFKNENVVVNNREDPTKFDLTDNYLLWAILSYCAPKFCKKRNNPYMVDDRLRTYIRESRNYLETIDQFLRGKVSIAPDISIIDSNKILEGLSRLQNLPRYSNTDVQDLYEWLGDYEYVGGAAPAFTPILDEIQNGRSSITADMVKNFMIAFDTASTFVRVKLLIGGGYRGKTDIGITAGNRERYFFGEKSRWNVLFVEDAQKMKDVLKKLIQDYSTYNNDLNQLLESYRKSSQPDTFVYYMLTYDYALWSPNDPASDLKESNNGNYFFAVAGDLDDMDMISIHSISSQPLSAYHIDPMVCAVIHECSTSSQDITNHIDYLGRYGNKRGIAIMNNDGTDEDFYLICDKDGWKIEIDIINLLSDILKEDLNLSYNKKVFELTTSQGALENDKVKIGTAVLKAIARHYGW